MHARVIVVAGPSGAGKSRLCRRLGLPYLNLDDFYKDGDDPTLPRVRMSPSSDMVDWDDPASWSKEEALETIARLCASGEADVPVYDIAQDGRVGHRRLSLGGSRYFVAEGIFAQEVARECAAQGVLADAICVHHHRLVTFWRRLRRDLREGRKPPLVLLRRGLLLMRAESRVVAHAAALGCAPMTPHEAYARVLRLLGHPGGASAA